VEHSVIGFAARLRLRRIEWLLTSIAVLVFAFFSISNPVLAASESKVKCVPHTAVTKSMIVASLSGPSTPAAQVSPTEDLVKDDLVKKDAVAPRSDWIRVAPLTTTYSGKCCCNSDCSSKSKSCC
jgi:hypothetical protein